jgi:hypothetical protein
MASAKMTRVAHSPPIDFSTWALPVKEALRDIVEGMADTALAEVVQIATEHHLHAWLPHEWDYHDGIRGKAPADPLTIYVRLPLGKDEDEEPAWSFSLVELIDQTIDLSTGSDDKIHIDREDNHCVVRIRNALADLVRKLDEACVP